MTAKPSSLLPLSAVAFAAFASAACSVPAQADPNELPYGPDTCVQGYVWREARDGDTVCVTPDVRTRTAQENATATEHREPGGGPYGPNTCKQGFVWREAFDGDVVCVTPDVREQTWRDNAAAQSRRQVNVDQVEPDQVEQQIAEILSAQKTLSEAQAAVAGIDSEINSLQIVLEDLRVSTSTKVPQDPAAAEELQKEREQAAEQQAAIKQRIQELLEIMSGMNPAI